MGEFLALHVAGHYHGTLRRVKEHRGGVKGRRGVDGLDPLQHVLLVCGREDKLAATTGVHLELMPVRKRARMNIEQDGSREHERGKRGRELENEYHFTTEVA